MSFIVSVITVFLFNMFTVNIFLERESSFLKEARNSLNIQPLEFKRKQ